MHVAEDLFQAGTYFPFAVFSILGERLDQVVQSCAIGFGNALGSDTSDQVGFAEMHCAKTQHGRFLRDGWREPSLTNDEFGGARLPTKVLLAVNRIAMQFRVFAVG